MTGQARRRSSLVAVMVPCAQTDAGSSRPEKLAGTLLIRNFELS
jgi:hypothetical protein